MQFLYKNEKKLLDYMSIQMQKKKIYIYIYIYIYIFDTSVCNFPEIPKFDFHCLNSTF